MSKEQSPDRLIHSAGQSDQDYYVYDICESKEHFQRFVDGQLGPAVQELGADAGGAPRHSFSRVRVLAFVTGGSSDSPPVPTMNSRIPFFGSCLPVGSIGA